MPAQTNGHNGSDRGQGDSAPSLIILPDGTPYSVSQITERLSGFNGHKILDAAASQGGCAEPERLEFRAFPDGTLVDLVRDSVHAEQSSLLIWKDGTVGIQKKFRYAGKEFVPCQIEPSLLSALRLPTRTLPCGGAQELFSELDACLSSHVELALDQRHLVCTYIVYTFFQDRLPVAPYLWLVGPYSSGKTTLLTLLQCFCRRAVMVGDVTAASLYALPNAITPTLIIDEFEPGRRVGDRQVLRLLRTGSARSGRVVRGSKLHGTFCPKIIASRQMPEDAALASRAIFVSMLPTSRTLPSLDDATLEKIADQFQPKLLAYRLQNYHRVVAGPTLRVPTFAPRLMGLAQMLAAPLLGDEKLENELFDALARQDLEAKRDRYGEPEWAVLLGLYKESHRPGTFTIGEFACTVNDVLAEHGETYRLEPRAVGGLVRSLGLTTEKLGNQGRGLRLTQTTVRQIHELARQFGLKRCDILLYATVDAGYGGPPCALCEEFGLMVREDGSRLRCVELPKKPPGRGLFER